MGRGATTHSAGPDVNSSSAVVSRTRTSGVEAARSGEGEAVMRRSRVRWWLLLVLALGLVTPNAVRAQGVTLDCSDFTTREGAQAVLDTHPGGATETSLDPDGNGLACESLPSRGGTKSASGPAGQGAPQGNAGAPLGTETPTPESEPTVTATATATAAGTAQTPLDARFGGSRQTFEKKYGKATGPDAGKYPLGFDYTVKGFDGVNVFYHRGFVAYLTLTANPRKPWAPADVKKIVTPFLPTDVKLSQAVKTDDGGTLVPGHSVALEKRFSQSTYTKYGASGAKGDLYYVFRPAADGTVQTIEVALGNVLPKPAGSATATPGAKLTPEDQAYFATLRQQFDTVAASMDTFDQTLKGLNDGSIAAGDAGGTLRNVFEIWRQADQDAKQLTAPASQKDTNDLYLQFTGLLATAADDYTNGLLNNDSNLIKSGDQKYGKARVLRALLDVLIKAAGA